MAPSLRDAAASFATVNICHDFPAARRELAMQSFAFLVTNIRLAEYNGLHLVFLAHAADPRCCAIAYTDSVDVWLGREAQRAGAFYDTRDCLPVTLPVFLNAQLPTHDRRNPAIPNRRTRGRIGGRRARDRHLASR